MNRERNYLFNRYEELLASHEGLLKVLESKIKESQQCYRENGSLRDELQTLMTQISNSEKTIETLCNKYLNLKERKDRKVSLDHHHLGRAFVRNGIVIEL